MQLNLHKLQVQTLNKDALTNASTDLAAKVGTLNPDIFKPDLLIGIRSGGYVVAEAMVSSFPTAKLLPLTCHRPCTAKKQNSSTLKSVLHKLPEFLTNRLRIIEHIMLTQLRSPKINRFSPDRTELTVIENFLRWYGSNPNILIVDDAVDSGATLATVVNIIRNIAGSHAIIKTAVITVTTVHPFIEPDYLLYRYVLCRFPWSFDFKS